jgi:hypothetical protein
MAWQSKARSLKNFSSLEAHRSTRKCIIKQRNVLRDKIKDGHTENRDVNAAQVNLIWARGQELSSIVVESPSSTNYGSMRQLGALRRQKLAVQQSNGE